MTFPTPEQDRRAFQRRPLRATARLVFSGGQSVEVRTYDLSEGGIGIVTDVSPPYGTNLTVRVRVPAGYAVPTELNLKVTVARSVLSSDEGGFKVGLEFDALDPAARAAIKRFLNPD